MTQKDYILNQYYQGKHELLQAIDGLTDEQLRAMPLDHWPIAWVVQHLCLAIDYFIIRGNTGEMMQGYDARFTHQPPEKPTPLDVFPRIEEMKKGWSELMDRAIEIIGNLNDEEMDAPSKHENRMVGALPMAEIILLMEYHLNVHLRNIWTIIGLQGIETKWAEQGKFKYI